MPRLERIQIYSAFRSAMLDYFSVSQKDGKRKKSTVSHRIAVRMMKQFPEDCTIDIDLDGMDILVTKSDAPLLSVCWSHTYLTEEEKEKARKHHLEKGPKLTLAFSLLEDKDYILVYRFERDYLEYLHIDKNTFSERLLKRNRIGTDADGEQLMLDIKPKKTRRRQNKDEKNEG